MVDPGFRTIGQRASVNADRAGTCNAATVATRSRALRATARLRPPADGRIASWLPRGACPPWWPGLSSPCTPPASVPGRRCRCTRRPSSRSGSAVVSFAHALSQGSGRDCRSGGRVRRYANVHSLSHRYRLRGGNRCETAQPATVGRPASRTPVPGACVHSMAVRRAMVPRRSAPCSRGRERSRIPRSRISRARWPGFRPYRVCGSLPRTSVPKRLGML